MQSTFISVFALVGGFSISSGEDEYELIRDATTEALLARSVDKHCLELDRGVGLAALMLKGMFNRKEYKDFDAALDNEVRTIRETRRQTIGQSLALVIKFTGEADLDLTGATAERADFVACFDAIDKDKVMASHALAVRAIATSFCLESKSICNIKDVTRGVYFRDEQGRVVYSFTAKVGSPRAYVSSPITTDNLRSISQRATRMLRQTELNNIYRLYAEMLNQGDDQLRAFLLGWAALEMFVNKTFKHYESTFIEGLKPGHPSVSNYLQRVRDVMESKYRLSDKFGVIAGLLSDEQTYEEDVGHFRDIKRVRDKLFHGEDIQKQTLPVSDLQMLLSKYLSLHLSVPG